MKIKILCLIHFRKLEDRYAVMKRKYRNNEELGPGDSRPSRIMVGEENEIKVKMRELRYNKNADI